MSRHPRIKVRFLVDTYLPRFTMEAGRVWEKRADRFTEKGFPMGGGFVEKDRYEVLEEIEMRIKEITSQHRRDFTANYQCEHCKAEYEGGGYDDANFHQNVIPDMRCKVCGEKAPDKYRPLQTKYPEGYQV